MIQELFRNFGIGAAFSGDEDSDGNWKKISMHATESGLINLFSCQNILRLFSFPPISESFGAFKQIHMELKILI